MLGTFVLLFGFDFNFLEMEKSDNNNNISYTILSKLQMLLLGESRGGGGVVTCYGFEYGRAAVSQELAQFSAKTDPFIYRVYN